MRSCRSFHRLRPPRTGHSLFEVLIVITVIGILATIALPATSNNQSAALKSAGRILASDLRLASDLSIQYGTQYTVTCDIAKNQYQLALTGPGNPPLPRNPSPGRAATASGYIVSIGQIDGNSRDSHGVRLLGAKLKTGTQSVTNISFGALGGTGPARADDTEVWLIDGPPWNPIYLRLTVAAGTGQVSMDQPTTYP